MNRQEVLAYIEEQVSSCNRQIREQTTLWTRLWFQISGETSPEVKDLQKEIQEWRIVHEPVEKAKTAEDLVQIALTDRLFRAKRYFCAGLIKANGDDRFVSKGLDPCIVEYFAELLKDWVPSKELILEVLEKEIVRKQKFSGVNNESKKPESVDDFIMVNLMRLRKLVEEGLDAGEISVERFSNEGLGIRTVIQRAMQKKNGERVSPPVDMTYLLAHYYLVDWLRKQ